MRMEEGNKMDSKYLLEIEISNIHKKIQEFDNELDEIQEAALNLLKSTMKKLECQLQEMQMKQELNEQFQEHISTHKQKLEHIERNECMEFLIQLANVRSNLKYAFEGTAGNAIQQEFIQKSTQFHNLTMDLKSVINTCKTNGLF